MKAKFILVLFVVFVLFGCSGEKKVVKINDFTMSSKEFEEEYNEAKKHFPSTKLDRESFLDSLIAKRLILQEAKKENLDKDEAFLKNLQGLYEQSLLKSILDKKSEEMNKDVAVSDAEIKATYAAMVESGNMSEPLDEVYDDIKWQIMRKKQIIQFGEWIKQLKEKADIKIDREALGIKGSN